MLRSSCCIALLSLGSCAMSSLAVESASGRAVSLAAMADDLAKQDVVFLGEIHDNAPGHRLELELIEQLHQRRPRLLISMEMFERDVQPLLDRWLAGAIDEKTFLAGARPWPNHVAAYRPILLFAKEHHVGVLAANVPRRLAHEVAKNGPAAVQGDPLAAASTTAPRDDYWQAFELEMKDHAKTGEGDDALYRMYQAQCLKDDTMAESMERCLAGLPPGQRPLVVHVCGKFHCDHERGTVARLAQRNPSLRIAVVTMQESAAVDVAAARAARAAGSYVLVVRGAPDVEAEQPVSLVRVHGQGRASRPGEHAVSRPSLASSEPSTRADPSARPALGFMPDYGADTGGGVRVAELRPDGPAEHAGIQQGDRIVRLGDQDVEDMQSYMAALGNLEPGQDVKVTVQRGAKQLTLTVRVGSR